LQHAIVFQTLRQTDITCLLYLCSCEEQNKNIWNMGQSNTFTTDNEMSLSGLQSVLKYKISSRYYYQIIKNDIWFQIFVKVA